MSGRESSSGPVMAALGGAAALAATVLLPFHLGGGFGPAIALGFLVGGVLLGMASIDLASRFPRDAGGVWMRNGAVLGAAGFLVSGLGLVGDVLGAPVVPAEVLAILATAAWWLISGWRLRFRHSWFSGFGMLAALGSMFAVIGQLLWEPPAGAVPARFAYVLWGPWGLWLAVVLSRGVRRRG